MDGNRIYDVTPDGEVIDPSRLSAEISRVGTDWVQKKHAADLLDKSTKAVLAQITNRMRQADPDLTRKEAEDLALGSDDYLSHVYATVDARRDANLARVQLDALNAMVEAIRSAEATKRAEMRSFHR